MKPIRVANLTPSISREAGGLFESVRHLSQNTLLPGRCEVTVVGLEDEHASADAALWAPLEVQLHKVRGPRKFSYATSLAPGLARINPDLIHLHGIWQYPSLAALRWARRTRRSLIVSPHGMLEPWSLQQSKWAKRLAASLYMRACLEEAACIRATSNLERDSIRKAGYRNKIAVIPNGVVLPPAVRSQAAGLHSTPRTVLFLSRIHPKKGLMNLLHAWSVVQRSAVEARSTEIRRQKPEVNTRTSGWKMRVVGPDERGHLRELKAEAERLNITDTVQFPGEAYGDARAQCYLDADLFVLPSCSENFGLVIAEALAFQVPVITTRAAPWSELETARCGWWIETGVKPLVTALEDAMSRSPAELAEMGVRGRRLIERAYTWEPIGHKMVELYEWAVGSNSMPECVA